VPKKRKKLTLGQSLRRLFVELSSTLRIKIFRQHLGMYLGGYIAQDVFNAVFTYYVVFVLMQEASGVQSAGHDGYFPVYRRYRHDPLCIRFGRRRLTAWWWCCLV
jgi:oligogalacturonide transporter